jgi:hypothetical protein
MASTTPDDDDLLQTFIAKKWCSNGTCKKKGAAALGKCRHVHGTLEPIKHKH